jgi:hypothetical protein
MGLVHLTDQVPVNCSRGKPAKTYFKIKSLDMTPEYWRNSTCAALGLSHELNSSHIYKIHSVSARNVSSHLLTRKKVAERIRVRCHATQDRTWGLTFIKYYYIQSFYRDVRAPRIYCRVPLSTAGMANFLESYNDNIFFSRWEYMTSYM